MSEAVAETQTPYLALLWLRVRPGLKLAFLGTGLRLPFNSDVREFTLPRMSILGCAVSVVREKAWGKLTGL